MSRKEEIYNYIKSNAPVEQAEIVRDFEEYYKNRSSATNAVGRFLRQLEDERRIVKQSVVNVGRGSIDKNLWEVRVSA